MTRTGLWRAETESSTYFINFDTRRFRRETHSGSNLEQDNEWTWFTGISPIVVGSPLTILWHREGKPDPVMRTTTLVTKVTDSDGKVYSGAEA